MDRQFHSKVLFKHIQKNMIHKFYFCCFIYNHAKNYSSQLYFFLNLTNLLYKCKLVNYDFHNLSNK